MRPQLPEPMAERIEAIYEQAGYGSESELVRDAVRRWVNHLEEKHDEVPHRTMSNFEYEVTSNSTLITLTLSPRDDAALRIGDSGGESQSIPTIYTGSTMITNETMKPALEAIDGVQNGHITHTGEIQIDIQQETAVDLDALVHEIFTTVDDVIRKAEDPVATVEAAAANYAHPRTDE